MALLILGITTLLCFYYILKSRGEVIAFLLFFPNIQWLIFSNLGIPSFRYHYYILILLLFSAVKYKNILNNNLAKKASLNPLILSFVVLGIILLIHGLILGITNLEGEEIFNRYFFQVIPLLLVALLLIKDESDIIDLGRGIIVFGTLYFFCLLFLADLQSLFDARMQIREDYGISPIGITRTFGIVFIVTYLYLINTSSLRYRMILFAVLLLSIYPMILSASRGPILSLVFVLGIYTLFKSNAAHKKIYLTTLFAVLIFAVYGFMHLYGFSLITRIDDLASYEEHLRYYRLQLAIDMLQNPSLWLTGLGPGGFDHVTSLNYVHNYILELLLEYGVFGAIVAVIQVSFGFIYTYKFLRMDLRYEYYFIPLIWFFYFLSSLVSGNIIGNRFLMIATVLLAVLVTHIKMRNK